MIILMLVFLLLLLLLRLRLRLLLLLLLLLAGWLLLRLLRLLLLIYIKTPGSRYERADDGYVDLVSRGFGDRRAGVRRRRRAGGDRLLSGHAHASAL